MHILMECPVGKGLAGYPKRPIVQALLNHSLDGEIKQRACLIKHTPEARTTTGTDSDNLFLRQAPELNST